MRALLALRVLSVFLVLAEVVALVVVLALLVLEVREALEELVEWVVALSVLWQSTSQVQENLFR
jgi:hypothetical protein